MRTFILLILLTSCVDKYPGEPLTLRNNSDQRIYFWSSFWKANDSMKYHYPDTILPSIIPVDISSIAPKNAIGTGDGDPDWKKIFSKLPQGKLSVYFFKEFPATQEDWDSIRQTYSLTRKDVTYEELSKNNYTIIYP